MSCDHVYTSTVQRCAACGHVPDRTMLVLADVAAAITASPRCRGSAFVHPAGDYYEEHVEYSEAGGDVAIWPNGTLTYRGMVLGKGLDTPEAVVAAIADVESKAW